MLFTPSQDGESNQKRGMMECWNDGRRRLIFANQELSFHSLKWHDFYEPNIPPFHPSIIPRVTLECYGQLY